MENLCAVIVIGVAAAALGWYVLWIVSRLKAENEELKIDNLNLKVAVETLVAKTKPDEYGRVSAPPKVLTMLRESASMWKGNNPGWDDKIADLLRHVK